MSDTARDRAEHTPTTEDIEEYFVNGHLVVHDGIEGDGIEKLRRWLAAEVAAAKAEALRGVAHELYALDPDGDAVFWTDEGYELVTHWLNDRADEIERTTDER